MTAGCMRDVCVFVCHSHSTGHLARSGASSDSESLGCVTQWKQRDRVESGNGTCCTLVILVHYNNLVWPWIAPMWCSHITQMLGRQCRVQSFLWSWLPPTGLPYNDRSVSWLFLHIQTQDKSWVSASVLLEYIFSPLQVFTRHTPKPAVFPSSRRSCPSNNWLVWRL